MAVLLRLSASRAVSARLATPRVIRAMSGLTFTSPVPTKARMRGGEGICCAWSGTAAAIARAKRDRTSFVMRMSDYSIVGRTDVASDCDQFGARSRSAEWRLIEAAELAGMKSGAVRPENIEGGEADHQMLADRALVKGVGGAWQFDLAMERLVGNAKQRAIGHAQPITLGGHGAGFHVNRDRPGKIDTAAFVAPAQLPIAVVVGNYGAGAQAGLQGGARFACDTGGGLLKRELHLGQGGNGNIGRHESVEDAILAEIAVRQHIIADALRLAETAAMADHQPAMRAQHGKVVGHVLGIGGTDADVDERDAAAIGNCEMVGRHLITVPMRA